MGYNWILFGYTIVICISSIFFEKTLDPALLLLIAILYIIAHFTEKRLLISIFIQIVLLIAFHSVSQMAWCLPLYFAQIGKHFHIIRTPKAAALISLLYTLTFALVSYSYMKLTLYNVSTFLFSSISCLTFAFLFYQYILVLRNQTKQLDNEKKHLTTHDALTGLYNYEECHRQLDKLVQQGEPIAVVLIDCKDLKSLNTANGFHGVNRILKQAAQLLRIMFPEALLISRYGGDEFAIVLESTHIGQLTHHIEQQLTIDFPKLTGIEMNFGMAFYPNDGMFKDDLIFIAERNLYMMKRESWLKREEHMLRSEKLRVVGELASGMAHEIRNPLTTIKGFLQLSRADNFNVGPWYDLIMDEITRMSMLTAEFLQFSKPHATQFKIYAIDECIQRVISLLDSEASRLGHDIQFKHAEQPLYLLMDQDKMLQLLLNLIKNAFEAMEEQGLVRIDLSSYNQSAVIEISDSGSGIPQSELEKIFLPFYTTKDTGTGLGLSICHKIVQDHEGTMEVESESGKGTKLTITIPLASPDAYRAETSLPH
ncbi:diguanylate cyclase (GGDEF) domain-containing protein [Paenibacillus sp. 1_12]|uniref:sensor histidine kinase n=1 Tax=Paenibacillus sp. 1_12 TaxID=1566278 RepID=UPI0008E016E9|nr:ATP-binding protein [Paenibacillus sp. 1_12]SFL49208.1 diguanylate cyclase (GGDEF) domain-containing protein [Paenibacillus sp. 1_12]